MAAHDLRNPIAAVESIAMIMELDDLSEETQDNLNMMKASCIKARTIIDEHPFRRRRREDNQA
ncbi:MAG TPA: histidine kinase dimerization/phospho-acceptor domain-containing protein [Mucilaginibacter sp.]|nr:histidine kinase dimerization/phospho-acceptor domain-containing protein [Mucilaginibacter sp.]